MGRGEGERGGEMEQCVGLVSISVNFTNVQTSFATRHRKETFVRLWLQHPTYDANARSHQKHCVSTS